MRCGGSDLQASSSRAEMLAGPRAEGKGPQLPKHPSLFSSDRNSLYKCCGLSKNHVETSSPLWCWGGGDFGSHCHAGSTLHKACFTLPPREDRLFNLPLLFCSFCCVEDAWMVSSPRSRPLVNTQGFDLGFGLQNCENFCSL